MTLIENLEKYSLTNSLDENIKVVQEIFKDDNTIKLRMFQNQYSGLKGCIFFIENMVNTTIINDNVLKPILENKVLLDDIDYISYLSTQIIISSNLKCSTSIDDLTDAIVSGNTVLFVEGCSEYIIISTSEWKTRAIEEPNSEKVLRGPKEGFTESLTTNLTLIRRKIRSKDLKFHYITVGERTRTKICICYIDGLVHENILNGIIDKIGNIYIDEIVDVKYIEEFIDDNPFSLFETSYTSEKPDVVSAKILEGRVAVLVDGSPSVMTAPSLFIELFMAGDDYYINYYYASLGRILRVLGFIATISIPALYISLVAFHQSTLPTQLLISIYTSRIGVPFPSFLELMILLAVFEVLREAGTRAPGTVGQAISIVGVLVLGTAAVDARLVSAPMIIIVGVSSITGLMLPNMTATLSFLRLGLLLLSSILGIYGYIFGMLALIIHLFSLRSCGIPFMGNLTSFQMQSLNDTIILEIFKSNTKIKPIYGDETIGFDIKIKTEVSIAELTTMTDYISLEGREKLKKLAEASLEKQIETHIKDVQKRFGFDIFGFGNIIRQRNPKLWKTIEEDWDSIFMDLDFNIICDIRIRNSGQIIKPIKVVE